MGFRYRKSINLGGGFRVNISKSGIGYSWGVKGYRITKTANGTIRRTMSIPGTGISYVDTVGKTPGSNYSSTENIVNGSAAQIESDGLEDILSAAQKVLSMDFYATLACWAFLFACVAHPIFILFLAVSIAIKLYIRLTKKIEIKYEIDADQECVVEQQMKPFRNIAESEKIWRIIQTNKVIDRKYTAGAGHEVQRVRCGVSKTAPFPFKTDTHVVCFAMGREKLAFFPDKLFLIQGSSIGALSYSDFLIDIHTTRFIESEALTKDAHVVDHTWRYVNKSGGPDRRFNNNRQLPICQYGEAVLKSDKGLNTVLMFSKEPIK